MGDRKLKIAPKHKQKQKMKQQQNMETTIVFHSFQEFSQVFRGFPHSFPPVLCLSRPDFRIWFHGLRAVMLLNVLEKWPSQLRHPKPEWTRISHLWYYIIEFPRFMPFESTLGKCIIASFTPGRLPQLHSFLHPALHQAAGASIIRDPDDAAPHGEWQRRVRAKTQGHAIYMWIAFNSEWHLHIIMYT